MNSPLRRALSFIGLLAGLGLVTMGLVTTVEAFDSMRITSGNASIAESAFNGCQA